jgi:hypothetical protein
MPRLALWAVLLGLGTLVVMELPGIRRYIKISTM